MFCEQSSCSSFSKHLSQGFLCSGEPEMRQLCKGVCASAVKNVCICEQATLLLLVASMLLDGVYERGHHVLQPNGSLGIHLS